MRLVVLGCALVSVCAALRPMRAPLHYMDPIPELTLDNDVSDNYTYASVYRDDSGVLKVRAGSKKSGDVAWGVFENGLNTTGWGVLNTASDGSFTDTEQATATGMVEGYLTAQHIHDAYHNLLPHVFKSGGPSPAVLEFLAEQKNWTRKSVADNPDVAEWRQIGLILAQLDGLVAGYGASAAPALEVAAFEMLNNVGDLFDIIPAVQKTERVDWLGLERREAELLHAGMGHCSGLIKVTGNYSDLFMGHSSWFVFSNTDRIFKTYTFEFSDPSTGSQRISFSSYPGFLESLDDFYMLSSGLGMVQTTNGVLDASVYEGNVVPQTLLAWQRVRLAGAMATTAQQWCKAVSFHSGGTYANQYMVVDFNLFTPGKPLKPNTLWVCEDMPGHFVADDQTATLARGYWPSYNIPFYPEIFNASGYPPMVEKNGNYFTYELAPRGQIFRRDAGNVHDMEGFGNILRYNDYLNDPYSFDGEKQNPMYAICSRGDLDASRASAFGCYDTKITSFQFGAKSQRALALNGPTTGNLPPFEWAAFDSDVHIGLPPVYNFSFVTMEPHRYG